MATRKSRNSTRQTTARASHHVDRAPHQQAAQPGAHQQIAIATETMSAWIRGAELWSQWQLQAVQRSGKTWSDAAERLRAATSPLDLISVQNQLVMDSVQQVLGLAQDFAQMTASMQARSAARPAEPASDTVEPLPAMMNAWQAMVDPMGLAGAAAASVTHH